MATVVFTQNLQRHVEQGATDVAGATVREVLEHVFTANPRLRGYVVDERGVLRKHMVIFIDGKQITERERLSDEVGPRSEVYVMQALSGG